ncbi:hypothetical protein [Burkholderia sp. WSM2230]|uniref:hypothetical protein n=1 Tax=Burkholderia sp. WSM2230 TaxID=944435 RepID=UPI00040074F5|nr:hypothetical protein [Burkholderia sp. WSM2230]
MIHATTRRSFFHATGAEALYRSKPAFTNALPLRIGLRLWGFDKPEVLRWGENLPTLGGRLAWEIMHDPDSDGVDVVIHLVRSSASALGSFCWNCVGANRAMHGAQHGSALNVAVFSGDARRLPAQLNGLWVIAGKRSEEDAVHEVARTLVVPRAMNAR